MKRKSIALVKHSCLFALAIVATVAVILTGCSTPAPTEKHYAAVLAIASDGVYGQWATNNHSLQALNQSFTKVMIAKGYSVCPIVHVPEEHDLLAISGMPDAIDQFAVKLGKETKVDYLFLAILNQATTEKNGDGIRLNIISKMFRLGNDYEHDEIIATHEWPEGGRNKTVSGDSQAVVQAIQKAAEDEASKYPEAADLPKSNIQ
jgi:hypothetical protein